MPGAVTERIPVEVFTEDSLDGAAVQTRAQSVQEFLQGEEEYCTFLSLIITYFLEPFRPSQHGGRTLMRIFKNIREAYRLHSAMLQGMTNATVAYSVPHQLATSFAMAIPALKSIYSQYCLDYADNMRLLQKKRKNSREFAIYISNQRDQCGGKDLAWLLRVPTQRLPLYQSLMRRLLSAALPDGSLERTIMAVAANSLTETCGAIDRQMEQRDRKRLKALEDAGSLEDGLRTSFYDVQHSGQEYEGWNVVILGDDDGNRCKTRLVSSLVATVSGKRPAGVQMFQNHVVPLVLEPPYACTSQEVYLRLWDSSGFENFPNLRAVNYPMADVVILTFSIGSRDSFDQLIPRWYREIAHHCGELPMLLVGLDCHLRGDATVDKRTLVAEEDIRRLANLLSVRYLECSSETLAGVSAVLMEAASCVVYLARHIAYKDEPRDVDDASEKVLSGILAQEIDLSCQGLKQGLPPDIIHCTNLTKLDLSWNMFQKMPDVLSVLTNLKEINLSHNQITDVKGLETMLAAADGRSRSDEEKTHLERINLEGNNLNFLPPGLGHCTNLMELRMADNPLDTLPKDILPKKSFNEYKTMNGRNQLYAYLRSIQEGGQAPHKRVKVMFVGDGEVGKTSLLNCFMELQSSTKRRRASSVAIPRVSRAPKDLSEPPPITDGIQISELHWQEGENSKDCVWDCWDYAGQDIYYTTHQFFLSAGAVYLVVFSLLNRDLSRVEYWLNSVHTRARGSPIILVGTHADDPRCTPAYVEDYRQDLRRRYMKRFKSKLGVPSIKALFTLSTKPNKRNMVTDEVRHLTDRIALITAKYSLVGKLYPRSWIGLEKHLRVLSKQQSAEPFMSWEEFRKIAHKCVISDEDINEAASFLHSSGVICHFNDERSGLSNLVILDPQFLTNVMSAVTFIKNGEITEKNLVHIWRAFDPKLHKTLMGLLERFEIAFELPHQPQDVEQRYLIPCLLPESQPSNYQQLWPAVDASLIYQLGRVYVFKFMPLGFFSRLFVRTLHMPNVMPVTYWRTGMIIKYEGTDMALLRYNPTEYKLTMQVRGPRASMTRGQLLRLLIENVETVIEGWYETDVDITVPCSHCVEAGSYSPHIFKLEDCIEKVTGGNGHPYVLCHGVRKVRIDALAPDISFADMRMKRIDFKDLTMKKVLGIGAFGKVYEASYGGETVAVKILEKQKKEQFSEYDEEDDAEFRRFNEFQREVWIMSCLRHNNLVQLKGLCTNPPAMVMEILRLGDLYHILYPKPAPVAPPADGDQDSAEALTEEQQEKMQRWEKMQGWHGTLRESLSLRLKIGLDIAKGMRYLHSLSPPIIHRDLRSPNIFMISLSEKDQTVAKVGDFGLSRLVATTLAGGDFNVNWLAPEVMREEQYTEKMDTYSFGIILWELIALEPPFAEYDKKYQGRPREVFKKAVIDGLRPTIPDDCPPEYAKLMQECWDGEPSKRPSFVEIVSRLVAIMTDFGFFAVEEDFEEVDEMEEMPMKQMSLDIQNRATVMELDSMLEPKHAHTVQCLITVATTVWAGCRNGVIRIWDIESGEFLEEFMANSAKVGVCDMQLISGFVWTAFDNGAITAFDTSSSNRAKGFRMHRVCKPSKKEEKVGVRCLLPLRGFSDLDPKAKSLRVLSGDFSGGVTLWKAKKKAPWKNTHEKILSFTGTGIESMLQDNDRVWIGMRNDIAVFDTKQNRVIAKWAAHRGPVNCLVGFGSFVWSGGHGGTTAVWDSSKAEAYHQGDEPEKRVAAHTSKVYALARCGEHIISGSFDMSVVAYDGKTMEVLQEEKKHKDGVRSLVAVSNNTFWSGSMQRDGGVCCWKMLV